MKTGNKAILWGTLILYAIIIAVGLFKHELWGDELQSWNLAKGSTDFSNLLSTIRYEGHPPIWYTLLWGLSKFTHEVFYIKYLHFAIALGMASAVLFLSPFPLILRVLIVFGYYFLFEYSVISRNYGIGVLFAFWAMYFQGSEFRYKNAGYFLMLFLASNTHLLACVLVVSIHVGNVLGGNSKIWSWKNIISFFIFIPAAYFIFPPSDSGSGFLFNKWKMNQLVMFFHVPLKSFFSIPSWWEYHFWNSNIFLDHHLGPAWLKNAIVLLVSLIIITAVFYLLISNLKARYLILSTVVATYLLNVIMPLTSMRYAGFFYFSFLSGLWFIYDDQTYLSQFKRNLLYLIFILQIPRGIFSLYKDFSLPFSQSESVVEISKNITRNSTILSNYWCINNLSAYLDRPYYCLETRQMESFVLWDSKIKSFFLDSISFKNGLDFYFKRSTENYMYLFSTLSMSEIIQMDSTVMNNYNFRTIQIKEGAIERSGNIYLFKVNAK